MNDGQQSAKDKNGTRRILFIAPDEKRKTIRLGKVSQRAAEGVKHRVEQLLECLRLKRPMDADLTQWVVDLEPWLAKRLAAVGLIPDPEAKPAATLGPFLKAWLASRKGDYKPASLISWGQVINALTKFLGADCPLVEVTPDKAGSISAIDVGRGTASDHDSQAVATCPHVLCARHAARFG